MDELNLIRRPTMEALIEEDYIDADNEDGLLHEQAVRSAPDCIMQGKAFEISEGFEAVPDDCQFFLEYDKDTTGFLIEKNGVWIDPEGVGTLSSGIYLYKGAGIIQRIVEDLEDIETLDIRIRPTRASLEAQSMSEEEIVDWQRDVFLQAIEPGSVFDIRVDKEGIVEFPPCILEYNGKKMPIKRGCALSAGVYRYAGDGVIERIS